MDAHLLALLGTAATIGLVHTLLGPDHYLPFVAMAKAGDWSRTRTLVVTSLCGLGHVAGSVILGVLGVALGWTIGGIEAVEAARGEWAAWALIVFGLIYASWGVRRALRNRPHTHSHVHADGTLHSHSHTHTNGHAHVHGEPQGRRLTPWVLFTIFVLGPCEPLIPVLMIPAAEHSISGLIAVTTVFGITTIGTMLFVTVGLLHGLRFVPLRGLERWAHALAGFAIFTSGAAVSWLGL
jgi:sulfite exporter TauE/SafE